MAFVLNWLCSIANDDDLSKLHIYLVQLDIYYQQALITALSKSVCLKIETTELKIFKTTTVFEVPITVFVGV